MKIKLMLNFLSLIFFFSSVSAFANETPANELNPPRWEKLGQKKVNYGLDRDEILVTAYEGRFTALRLKVDKSGINLHKIAIHFRNGEVQEFDAEASLVAGSISRVLDLRGDKRIIQKVVFWYDTKNFADKKAVVELWGRH